MKKVYIVADNEPYEGITIDKVFEKEEDAKQYIKKMKENDPIWNDALDYFEEEVF